jgi:excisionase family DNA binding protein
MHLLTLTQAAEELSVSVKTLRREIKAGKLVSYSIRGAVRLNREDLNAYLAAQRREKPPEQARGAGAKPRKVTGGFQYMGA